MKRQKLSIIQKIFCIITVCLFAIFIIVPGVLFFILPKQKTSEIERRELEKLPEFSYQSLFSGQLTDDFSTYYSDNFIFRDFLVKTSFSIKDLRGIRADGVKIYDSTSQNNQLKSNASLCIDMPLTSLNKSFLDNITVSLGEKPLAVTIEQLNLKNKEEYADITKADLEGEKRGALYVIGDTALEIFYGNSTVAFDYATVINGFRNSLPQNVCVYNEVIPTHFEFGLPTKLRETVGTRQKPYIDTIYENLDSGVISVDGYTPINNHYNNGEYLYFRSDHHWTALGAYYAYTAFAEAAGFTPTPLSDFETGKIDKFLGTFYSSYDKALSENPDFVEYYLPFTPYEMQNYNKDGSSMGAGKVIYENISSVSNGYLAFTGGDKPLSVIKTSNETGRSIIVFKESYGNAFIPFLLAHFDTIYVADIRSFPFETLSFIEDKGITDVLFLNNIMSACTPARVTNIMNLLK